MRPLALLLLSAALLAALAPAASAQDELVVLRDGKALQAKVTATTVDSVSVSFKQGEAQVKAVLSAEDLAPHSFYRLRSRAMEKTVENHLALARWSLDNDLIALAKVQADQARKLDPEAVERRLSDKAVRERVAGKLLDYARRQIARGRFDEAERWLDTVIEEFDDTHGDKARELVRELAKEQMMRAEERERARRAKLEAMKDAKQRAAAEARIKALEPIVRARDRAQRMFSEAVTVRGTKAKRRFEAVAKLAVAAMERAKRIERDTVDGRELDTLIDELKRIAVKSHLHAGRVELLRRSYVEAEKDARKALAIDPTSAEATRFLTQIAVIRAIENQN